MDQICIVCSKEVQIVQNKACDCQYCYECCLQWMESQLSENSKIENFKCLNYECQETIGIYSFYESISDPKLESKYQEITFKNYLINTKDIKACPNQTCKNSGIVPSSRCLDLLQCTQCDYKWFDKDCLSRNKQCTLFFKNLKNDVQCFAQKFWNAHHCPNCDVEIIKNGGCNHMTCKSCTHEYCYLCNQVFAGHDTKLCNSRNNIFRIVLTYLFFVQAYYLGIHLLIQHLFILILYGFELLISTEHKLLIYLLLHILITIKQIYDRRFKDPKFYCHQGIRKYDKKKISFQLLYLLCLIPLGILIYCSGLYQMQIAQIYKFLPQIVQFLQFSNITVLIIIKNKVKRNCF